MRALDLFAGTGWGVACQALGIEEFGVDNAPTVLGTRELNGMTTVFKDAWEGLHDEAIVPDHDILIASPPCQTFSLAGSGEGRRALDDVLRLIAERAYYRVDDMRAFALEHGDERTALVLAPLAYAARFRPMYVVFEQVPPVLPVWEACAVELRAMGYSAWAGHLQSEQYGVPQTRRRAILIARRDGKPAAPPAPTHSRFHSRSPEKLDPGVLPWVSMGQALGWTDPALVGFPRRADEWATAEGGTITLDGEEYRARDLRESDQPAFNLTGKARSWTRWQLAAAGRPAGNDRRQYPRRQDQPAPTITGARSAAWVADEWVRSISLDEAARLQTYPAGFGWTGSRTSAFQQIGNAVPPLLAQRVLEAALA